MNANNRIYLFVSGILSAIFGFLLPVIVARRFSDVSDELFLFLAIINPLIMFLSFDQRKHVLVGSDVSNEREWALRIYAATLWLCAALFATITTGIWEILPIAAIKILIAFSELKSSFFQRSGNYFYVFLWRLAEGIILLVLVLQPAIVIAVFVLFLAVVVKRPLYYVANVQHNMSALSNRLWLGLQSAGASVLTYVPVYVITLVNDATITVSEYSVQMGLMSGFYMLSSLHLSIYSDRLRSKSSRDVYRFSFWLSIFYVFALPIGALIIVKFNLFYVIYGHNLILGPISIFIMVVVLINILKNIVYTVGFSEGKAERMAKYRVLGAAVSMLAIPMSQFYGLFSLVFIPLVGTTELCILLKQLK